jgi:hypothetical protein
MNFISEISLTIWSAVLGLLSTGQRDGREVEARFGFGSGSDVSFVYDV